MFPSRTKSGARKDSLPDSMFSSHQNQPAPLHKFFGYCSVRFAFRISPHPAHFRMIQTGKNDLRHNDYRNRFFFIVRYFSAIHNYPAVRFARKTNPLHPHKSALRKTLRRTALFLWLCMPLMRPAILYIPPCASKKICRIEWQGTQLIPFLIFFQLFFRVLTQCDHFLIRPFSFAGNDTNGTSSPPHLCC